MQAELGNDAACLRLYPDPSADQLKAAIAGHFEPSESHRHVFVGNGSDEVLAHAFMGLLNANPADAGHHSFYPVCIAVSMKLNEQPSRWRTF